MERVVDHAFQVTIGTSHLNFYCSFLNGKLIIIVQILNYFFFKWGYPIRLGKHVKVHLNVKK